MTVGDSIREVRIAKRIRRREFAAHTGINESRIVAIENGEMPDSTELMAISHVLGTSVDYFLRKRAELKFVMGE